MDRVQAVSIAISAALLVGVIELVRRKKLTEEYSFVWILCAIALLGLSVTRSALDRVALELGIFYPPAALLLVVILFVFVSSVLFSVVVSRQRQQIDRLMEDTALLEARIRELEATRGTEGSGVAAGEEEDRYSKSLVEDR
jgi:hypothetical protein